MKTLVKSNFIENFRKKKTDMEKEKRKTFNRAYLKLCT